MRLRAEVHLDAGELTTKSNGDEQRFLAALEGLSDEMVNASAYKRAIELARDALGDPLEDIPDELAQAILERVTGHVTYYAKQVPARLAARLAEVLEEINDSPAFAAKLDDQLEAFRSAVTRYGQPTWTAGQETYGRGLDANDVKLLWVLGDANNCPDCIALEGDSPYTAADIPTWPKGGETVCMDYCYCSVVADADSWNETFNVEE